MIYLKILLQLCVGISALLVVFLDYKWHDKRTKKFKITRDVLIGLTITMLIGGIGITIHDNHASFQEKKVLTIKLENLQDSLIVIKDIGLKLNHKLDPFLEFVKNKYPGIPIENALDSLKKEVTTLEQKTKELIESDSLRRVADLELVKLKSTPPNIDAILAVANQDELTISIQPLNNIPIKFKYSISTEAGMELKVFIITDPPVIIPKEGISDYYLAYGKLANLKYINEKPMNIRLKIDYESLYFEETGNMNLKKTIVKDFYIDVKNKIIRKSNNGV